MSEVMPQPSINLSTAAKQHIVTFLQKNQNSKGVRFAVKKTGCSGLSYVVDYVEASQLDDIIQPIDNHYQLFIDKASFPYLQGMSVDYIKQGLNYKFVFINPNQTGQCGCGESFTVAD